jgi:hypothetical protein
VIASLYQDVADTAPLHLTDIFDLENGGKHLRGREVCVLLVRYVCSLWKTPSYSRKRGHCAITLQSKLPVAKNTVD